MISNNPYLTFDNEASFRALFEFATLGIVIVNSDGHFVTMNPFAEKLFGYHRAELVGRPVEVLIPAAERKPHRHHRSRYQEDPQPRQMGKNLDLYALRKDGSTFPVEISLGNYEEHGETLTIAFVNDITERKQAELREREYLQELEKQVQDRTAELLESLQREKELNEVKSRFVSLASHEFRTPLSTILTSLNLLERYQAASQTVKRQKHVDRIRSSVKMLTQIINDFLSLDRLEQGKIDSEKEAFNLSELMFQVKDELGAILKPGQEIVLQVPDMPEVNLNPKLVKNILINLGANAVKYSPEKKPIHLGCELSEQAVILHVRDEGIGIPDKDQKKLFTMFFRASNVGDIQGTGLGLNIVRKYVDLMGGEISVESQVGVGTAFHIHLPQESDEGVI